MAFQTIKHILIITFILTLSQFYFSFSHVSFEYQEIKAPP